MSCAITVLIFGGVACLLAAILGGLFEQVVWMIKGWRALETAEKGQVRSLSAGDAATMTKALAELFGAIATAPVWIALLGAALAMLFSAKALT
jgi:hypothetical protein